MTRIRSTCRGRWSSSPAACRGVGRGIAERFLEAGADVVVCCRHEPEALPAGGGRAASFVAADIRDPDEIDAVVAATIERIGRLDVLVNNAGRLAAGRLRDRVAAVLDRRSSTLNLIAPLVFAQRANAVMQAQAEGGAIINIASVSGIRPSPDTARVRRGQGGPAQPHADARPSSGRRRCASTRSPSG